MGGGWGEKDREGGGEGGALDKISEAQQNRPLKSTGLECEQAVNQDAISRAAACDQTKTETVFISSPSLSSLIKTAAGGFFFYRSARAAGR